MLNGMTPKMYRRAGTGTGMSGVTLLIVSIYHQFEAITHFTHSMPAVSILVAIAVDAGFVFCEMALWLLYLYNDSIDQKAKLVTGDERSRVLDHKISRLSAQMYLITAVGFSAAMNVWSFTHQLSQFSRDWWIGTFVGLFIPFGIFVLSKVSTQLFLVATRLVSEAEACAEAEAEATARDELDALKAELAEAERQKQERLEKARAARAAKKTGDNTSVSSVEKKSADSGASAKGKRKAETDEQAGAEKPVTPRRSRKPKSTEAGAESAQAA